jgi:hypothetical protein
VAEADAATDAAMDAALRRLQDEHAMAMAAAEERHRAALDQMRTLAATELDVERQRCDDLRQQRAEHKAATEATVMSLEARLKAAETRSTEVVEAAVQIAPPPPHVHLMDDAITALGATAAMSTAATDAEVRRLVAQLQASKQEAAALALARDRAVSECHSVREEMELLRVDVDATLAATNRACEQLRTTAAASESRALEAERLLQCMPSDSQVGCVTNDVFEGFASRSIYSNAASTRLA